MNFLFISNFLYLSPSRSIFSDFLLFVAMGGHHLYIKRTIPSHTNIMQFYATFINASSIMASNKNEVELHAVEQ